MKQLNTVQFTFHLTRTHDYPWHMYVTWIFRFALVFTAAVDVAECCFGGGGSGSQNDVSNPQPSGLKSGTTSLPATNRQPCTAQEQHTVECLNKGTCFALPNSNSQRSLFCQCTNEWIGTKCEQRNYNIYTGQVQAAGSPMGLTIALSIAIPVVFMILAGSMIYLYCTRWKNKEQEKTKSCEAIVDGSNLPTVTATNVEYTIKYVDSPNASTADASCEKLVSRESNGMLYRNYPFPPAPPVPQEDRSSVLRSLGDTSIQYSLYSRSSTYSQVRQHETSI